MLVIKRHGYFTQSPSCIMTCSLALTKAWYRTVHGKVTFWFAFPGFKKQYFPQYFGFSLFCTLLTSVFRSVLACFKLLNGHAEGSAA